MNQKTIMRAVLIAVLSLVATTASYAYEFEVGGFYYNKNEDGTTVSVTFGNNNYSGDVVIPSSVKFQEATYTVASIGSSAFSQCRGLISITIPNSVTSIGSSAFYGCSGLTSITIPNSVTSIGTSAFEGCTSLTRVDISSIEAWLGIEFSNYTSTPLYYAHHIYLNGKEVKDLVIPESVTSIEDHAFQGCSNLTSISIPNSVTSIGICAFSGCI